MRLDIVFLFAIISPKFFKLDIVRLLRHLNDMDVKRNLNQHFSPRMTELVLLSGSSFRKKRFTFCALC